jgi:ribose 5-phosphate isomerase B
MNIAVGNDHAAFEDPPPHYKPAVVEHLQSLGHEVIDCGAYDKESVDYPDFAQKVADEILGGRAERGVLICGTGIGICIAANRNPGIRASTVASPEMARLTREHNDSNVICFGRRTLSLDKIIEYLDIWLTTPFSGGERHSRRVQKLG